MRVLNQATIDMIKSFEELKLTAYRDMVGKPTIGWGCTIGVSQADVDNGRTITVDEAEQMFAAELAPHQVAVANMVSVPMNDNQFGALVSFCYNLGDGSLHGSHLLAYLNAGNVSGAVAEFPKWDHAGGVEVKGLTRRRLAEQALFLQAAGAPLPDLSSDILPNGPSDQEIEDKLKDLE